MDNKIAKKIVEGTIIFSLVYSTICWLIIVFSWLGGGGWLVVSGVVFVLWVFLFFGFSLRHIVEYVRASRHPDEWSMEDEFRQHERFMRGIDDAHKMLDEMEDKQD